MLDFSVGVTLDGEPLSEDELRQLLTSAEGLLFAQGKVGRGRSREIGRGIRHWKDIERHTRVGGISFFEGMRLLSGATLDRDAGGALPEAARQWVELTAGAAVEETV